MTKRKPNRFEMTFLMMWHGVLTGGLLLTYVSGDDVYFLHQFAGYVVCGALLLRLLVAFIAPKTSPLSLSMPKLFDSNNKGRSPIYAWMAVGMIAATALAAFSGLLAETIGFDDLHEGLAEGVLPAFIFAHIALVLLKPLAKKVGNISADEVAQAKAVATTLTTKATLAVRRIKPYLTSKQTP
ncbi:MAG: hypothetical protein COB59_08205 [Rhodospirillaceae bacterium]|nr:MAG: hypothetical protein COB59_08205 [Rhodospirillaceae bacterium]